MKYVLLSMLTLFAAANSRADLDLCANKGATSAATNTLRTIQRLAREADLDISSSGVESCNATSVVVASEIGGAGHVQIEDREICGALLTFKDAKGESQFAQWLLDQHPELAGKSCVAIDVADPLPGVSASNDKEE